MLVDEIDQRVHPDWQRVMVSQVSTTFPQLQFVVSAHSPLLLGSLRPENIIVLEPDLDAAGDGAMRATRFTEDLYGHSFDLVLESSYFGLAMARSDPFRQQLQDLSHQARDSPAAAIEFHRKLAHPGRNYGRSPIQPLVGRNAHDWQRT